MNNILAKLAQSAASTVSDKYKFIDTQLVTEMLADYGFIEDKYKQHRARNPETVGYQKHISIFNRGVDVDSDGGFNIMLVNGHDGKSALCLEAGYFRILCENQLVHGLAGVRVTHRGNVADKIEQAIPAILGQMEDFKQLKAKLCDTTASPDVLRELMRLGCELRDINPDLGANLTQFGVIRRRGDSGTSLWNVFNVVQENTVRGGVRVLRTDKNGVDQLAKLRALTSADRILEANKALSEIVLKAA